MIQKEVGTEEGANQTSELTMLSGESGMDINSQESPIIALGESERRVSAITAVTECALAAMDISTLNVQLIVQGMAISTQGRGLRGGGRTKGSESGSNRRRLGRDRSVRQGQQEESKTNQSTSDEPDGDEKKASPGMIWEIEYQ